MIATPGDFFPSRIVPSARHRPRSLCVCAGRGGRAARTRAQRRGHRSRTSALCLAGRGEAWAGGRAAEKEPSKQHRRTHADSY